MVTLTASAAKEKFLSLVRKTNDFGSSYTITHNGKPCAVLLGADEYDGLIETLEILKDKSVTQELLVALQEADQGKTVTFEEVVERIENWNHDALRVDVPEEIIVEVDSASTTDEIEVDSSTE